MNYHQIYTDKLVYLLFYLSIIPSKGISQDNAELYREFSFEKNLTLNDIGEEYFFGIPFAVVSDSEENIFVADYRQMKITVFNPKGEHLYSFGSSGRGPDEFLNITTLTPFEKNKLLVFDFIQQRFTVFLSDGKIDKTIKLDKDLLSNVDQIKPDYIRYSEKNGFLMFYRENYGANLNIPLEQEYLIHIVSKDLTRKKAELVSVSSIINVEDDFEKYFEGGIYRGIFHSNDSLITIAPYFFRGDIHQYFKSNRKWKLSKKFKGYVETNRTYEAYDDYRDVIGIGYAANSNRFGYLAGIMKNESLGIFQKQNGDYLYLGLLEIDGKQRLYVNLFYKGGELKAHGPVTNLHPGIQDNDFYRRMRFYWMDDQDQLYVIDGAEDGFYVYRGTIDMKE